LSRYYKRAAEEETGLGDDVLWMELRDNAAVRQVEWDNGEWLCSLEHELFRPKGGLAEGVFSDDELGQCEVINREEFERVWDAAAASPHYAELQRQRAPSDGSELQARGEADSGTEWK
jgi:hypothetical protein